MGKKQKKPKEQFSAADRAIFRYEAGGQVRHADPMAIKLGLLDHETFTFDDVDAVREADDFEEPTRKSYRDSLKGIRDVFGLDPLAADGTGVTDDEAFAIFWQFAAYVGELKKKLESSQTSPVATELRVSAG